METLIKNSQWIVVLGLGAALVGCNQTVKITDGQVPNELLPYVQKFLGEYTGQIEHRATSLVATLDGNRLVLKSIDDLIAPACMSKIGNLTKLTYEVEKDKSVTVKEALIDFDPALCANDVKAKELEISVKKGEPITLDIRFFDHYEWVWTCSSFPDVHPVPMPPVNPGEPCWQDRYAVFQTGRFIHK